MQSIINSTLFAFKNILIWKIDYMVILHIGELAKVLEETGFKGQLKLHIVTSFRVAYALWNTSVPST